MKTITPTSKSLGLVLEAIEEAVRESGSVGLPGGHIYASLMGFGCSFSLYEHFMATLVAERKVVKKGQVYFSAN